MVCYQKSAIFDPEKNSKSEPIVLKALQKATEYMFQF